MQVCQVSEAGGAEQLTVRDRDTPAPQAGQVLVAVAAAGIGFADAMMRSGGYPGVDPAGQVLGLEVAGTVSAVGPDVPADLFGQRVYALCGSGGYAEAICLDARTLVPLPEAVSCEAAVATGLNAIVAHLSLQRADLVPGEAVLVRGASGGIGSMAVQLAVAAGATCTAASSKPEQARSLGARAVVDRSGGDDTYDIILDPVAGPDTGSFFGKLRPNGRIVICGAAGGFPPPDFAAGLLDAFFSSPTLSTLSLSSVPPEQAGAAMRTVFGMVAEGRLRPVIARRVGLLGIPDAHRELENGAVVGKIILRPPLSK